MSFLAHWDGTPEDAYESLCEPGQLVHCYGEDGSYLGAADDFLCSDDYFDPDELEGQDPGFMTPEPAVEKAVAEPVTRKGLVAGTKVVVWKCDKTGAPHHKDVIAAYKLPRGIARVHIDDNAQTFRFHADVPKKRKLAKVVSRELGLKWDKHSVEEVEKSDGYAPTIYNGGSAETFPRHNMDQDTGHPLADYSPTGIPNWLVDAPPAAQAAALGNTFDALGAQAFHQHLRHVLPAELHRVAVHCKPHLEEHIHGAVLAAAADSAHEPEANPHPETARDPLGQGQVPYLSTLRAPKDETGKPVSTAVPAKEAVDMLNPSNQTPSFAWRYQPQTKKPAPWRRKR